MNSKFQGTKWARQTTILMEPCNMEPGIILPSYHPPWGAITDSHTLWLRVDHRKLHNWANALDEIPDQNVERSPNYYESGKMEITSIRLYNSTVEYLSPIDYQINRNISLQLEGQNNYQWRRGQDDIRPPHYERRRIRLDEGISEEMTQRTRWDAYTESFQEMVISEAQFMRMWCHENLQRPNSVHVHFRAYNQKFMTNPEPLRIQDFNDCDIKPILIKCNEANLQAFIASIWGALNLIGKIGVRPLSTEYFKRISDRQEFNEYKDDEFQFTKPTIWPEDKGFVAHDGTRSESLIEKIYDQDLVISDVICHSSGYNDQYGFNAVRHKHATPLNQVIVVLKGRSECDTPFITGHLAKRNDSLARMFPFKQRPYKLFHYLWKDETKEQRKQSADRLLFLKAINQDKDLDDKEYYRETEISVERQSMEGTSRRTANIKRKSCRAWMEWVIKNNIYLTNLNENFLVTISHKTSDEELENQSEILSPCDSDGIERPFAEGW